MIKRLLFIAEGQLGDLLILTPAIRETRRHYPDAYISVAVLQRRTYTDAVASEKDVLQLNPAHGTSEVLLHNPNVNAVFEIDRAALRKQKGIKRLKAEWQLLRYIRQQGFDAVVCTFAEKRFNTWAYFSGARTRVGQKQQSSAFWLTHTPDIQKEVLNVLNYYCALVESLGVEINNRKTEFFCTESSRQWARQQLCANGVADNEPIVLIHPGASGVFRVWPPEYFAQLIRSITAHYPHRVVICTSPYDEAVVAAIGQSLDQPVITIDNGKPLSHLAALIEASAVCISNDSGPRHLAIALGVASLSFMTLSSKAAWEIYPQNPSIKVLNDLSLCDTCQADGYCREQIPAGELYSAACLRKITVSQAEAALKSLLNAHVAKDEPAHEKDQAIKPSA